MASFVRAACSMAIGAGLVVPLSAAAALALGAPAYADPPDGAGDAASAGGHPDTEADIGARAEVGADDTVGALKARLAAVRAQLDDLYADADQAILDYLDEEERLDDAEQALDSARRAADRARERHADSRNAAVRHAVSAYKGADLHPSVAFSTPGGPQEVLDRSGYIKLLGDRRGQVLKRAKAAGVAADTLRSMAASAAEEQQEATKAAAAAKRQAFDAVQAEEDAFADILARQSRLQTRLSHAQGDGSGREQRRTRALARAQQAAAPGSRIGGRGQHARGADSLCTGVDLSKYANGRIPRSALCPLPQPGEMLRADAAAAFIELDGAFQDRFGRPMCVADSYRPLDEQVRLFREMAAGMAAHPGTSTHGLGRAVDLCGGVNEYGSVEHEWMLANAPAYGWENPAWARNGFEPWHWEFAGR
ncbi:hypothetical protein GCM10009799_16480 [Nocardiopsis rhodophaea]|uniref:D-alanyl-D-alanine carboxypeptidase-like core domain-containing protein n=1 Tax=Nocardiopsis rhodophaea TaxID=280238 RepID=A0ABP5E3Z1_9ACTN